MSARVKTRVETPPRPRHRVFVSAAAVRGARVVIEARETLHHLVRVLRVATGEWLICCDGQGGEVAGPIVSSGPMQLTVEIIERREKVGGGTGCWLIQALPKSDRFEWILQKATELGVERITPVLTERTVVRLDAARAQAKQARWRRIVQEAAEQSQRATIPELDPVQSFDALLKRLPTSGLVLLPTLATTAVPLRTLIESSPHAAEVAVLIGPEGDFSLEEVQRAQAHGARPVSLGSLTLRSETAALAALAILRYALGCS